MWRVTLFLVAAITIIHAEEDPTDGPINRAIAATPVDATISIPKTGTLMDLGSVFNDITFPEGRSYRLVLDIPFEFSGDGLRYHEVHFRISTLPDHANSEILLHNSVAEHRLIALLEKLVSSTTDPHQKKNATTLLIFLKDRKRGFPMGKKWWDYTPWQVDWSRVDSPSPTASPNPNDRK